MNKITITNDKFKPYVEEEVNKTGLEAVQEGATATKMASVKNELPALNDAGSVELKLYKTNEYVKLGYGDSAEIQPVTSEEDEYYRSLTYTATENTKGTLTYNTNGGSAIDPVTVDLGTEVTLSTDTTKEGFTFDAWCSDAELTTEVTKVTVNGNVTVYAKWTENVYTITFDAGEGTVDPASAQTTTGRKLAELPTPVYADHNFDGWFTEAEGGTEVTTDTVFTADTTIYAHYSTEG